MAILDAAEMVQHVSKPPVTLRPISDRFRKGWQQGIVMSSHCEMSSRAVYCACWAAGKHDWLLQQGPKVQQEPLCGRGKNIQASLKIYGRNLFLTVLHLA